MYHLSFMYSFQNNQHPKINLRKCTTLIWQRLALVFFILLIFTNCLNIDTANAVCPKFCYQISKNTKPNPTYVALGDSITLGTGLTNKESNFVTLFGNHLKDATPNLVTINYGKNGYTISDITKKISEPEVKEKLKQAKYVTITAGGNDILNLTAAAAEKYTGKNFRSANSIPSFVKNEATAKLLLSYLRTSDVQTQLSDFLNTFQKDYSNLLKTVKTAAPNAIIFAQTIYNPASGSDYQALSECIEQVMPKANAIIKDCVKTENASDLTTTESHQAITKKDSINLQQPILLLDTYQLFQNNAPTYVRIAKDDIHPTQAGHQLIAINLERLLKEYQKTGQPLLSSPAQSFTSKRQKATKSALANAMTPRTSNNPDNVNDSTDYFANRFLTFGSIGLIFGLCLLCGIRILFLKQTRGK